MYFRVRFFCELDQGSTQENTPERVSLQNQIPRMNRSKLFSCKLYRKALNLSFERKNDCAGESSRTTEMVSSSSSGSSSGIIRVEVIIVFRSVRDDNTVEETTVKSGKNFDRNF